MTRIAFLGLGAMGSRMAGRLVAAGHDVTVWNRSPAATAPLVEAGAKAAATPAEAVAGAEVAIAMLRDDAASAAVWLDEETGALAALDPGAIVIDCSTLSLPAARSLAERVDAAGIAFLDAPVAGSRPQAEAGALIFLAGGAADTLDRARPVLEAMGGAIHHAGPTGAGTTVKLMVNALFAGQLALMAELIALAKRAGVEPRTAIDVLKATPVTSPAAGLAADAMLAGRFDPAFPIELVAKDMGAVTGTAASLDTPVPVAEALQAVYGAAVGEGFGAANITGIVQRYA